MLRVATVLGTVAVLAVAVVLTAAVITDQSAGKGGAINVAGSLRMQSYLLAVRVAAAGEVGVDPAKSLDSIEQEISAFERRLASARLTDAIGADDGRRSVAYRDVARQWQELRALARASAADSAQRALFLGRVHPFVADVDHLVTLLEDDLESRIDGLQVALDAALLLILVLVVGAIVVLDMQVFRPITMLARMAQAVRGGNFRVRLQTAGSDELGQLARDFNHMVEELGSLYGSLEAQIAVKTADLAQKNQSLSLLYETAQELAGPQLDRAALQRVADRVRRVLGATGVVICARHGTAERGMPLACAEKTPGSLCLRACCDACLETPLAQAGPGADGVVVSIPLLDGDRRHGVMPLMLPAGQTLAPWQVELAQTVGRHIGAALAAAEARDEHRRLALFEERSAIARELHDSLAQSLSYMKIQLARLSALLMADPAGRRVPDAAAAREVVQQLREGVSSAYRQLRELLTTFRLQLSGQGLTQALRDTVADLRHRSTLEVTLLDELSGVELSANQQIHMLQIVREALSNVEQHARARHAWVRLTRAEPAPGMPGSGPTIEVAIEDDGVGIASMDSPRNHFGLLIMRDRAALLGGALSVERRQPTGTQVRLRFRLQSPFGALPGSMTDAAMLLRSGAEVVS